jgi:hypothetical protein
VAVIAEAVDSAVDARAEIVAVALIVSALSLHRS